MIKLLKYIVKHKKIDFREEATGEDSMVVDQQQESILQKVVAFALGFGGDGNSAGSEPPVSRCLGKLVFYTILRLPKNQKPPA